MRLSIGDQVTTPNGAQAILRWTGRIEGKPIEYAGVELVKGTGLHSGEHNGVKYFEVDRPNSGIFVSYSKLVSANVVTPLSSLGETRLPQRESNSDKARLESLLEEREAKIRELKAQIEERRIEFRTHLASIESDRNQLAEHYEGLLREYSGGDVLEGQRAALAAMQNSLMEENQQIKEQLEAERAKKSASIPTDLEAVLSQLTAQQELIAEMESDAKELDSLRAQNVELKLSAEQLKSRCDEMEAALNEVESLKASMEELELNSNNAVLKTEVEELRAQLKESDGSAHEISALRQQVNDLTAQLSAAKEATEVKDKSSAGSPEVDLLKKQVEELTASVASQKRRADKATSDAQMAQKDAQMYFKMSDPDTFENNKRRIKELEEQVVALRTAHDKLEAAATLSGPPAAPAPAAPIKNSGSAKSEEDLERELEDQILREAGLLEDTAVAGREQWCGLCERSGHTSVDCPYE